MHCTILLLPHCSCILREFGTFKMNYAESNVTNECCRIDRTDRLIGRYTRTCQTSNAGCQTSSGMMKSKTWYCSCIFIIFTYNTVIYTMWYLVGCSLQLNKYRWLLLHCFCNSLTSADNGDTVILEMPLQDLLGMEVEYFCVGGIFIVTILLCRLE